MTEFDLIARYFTRPVAPGGWVRTGVGDDCALLDIGATTIAITTDMLIEGRHFFPGTDAAAIGHKALAVNLSDLAAAGATPRCFFLALGMPRADEQWLAGFSAGLFALADRYDCVLAGGDTTRTPTLLESAPAIADTHQGAAGAAGPLTISITALGEVPRAQVRGRDGAHVGDDVWVSGSLGGAALALAVAQGEAALAAAELRACRERLDRPLPRIELGIALRGLATAAIDVSDGLLGDLGHVLSRSGVGAIVDWPAVPRSAALRAQAEDVQQRCALAGGDDYELLFTASTGSRDAVLAAAQAAGVEVSRIGRIDAATGLRVCDAAGRPIALPFAAYDHFAGGVR
jgi:thiamine-monophosphate kinase